MDFDLAPDQVALRDAAADLLGTYSDRDRVRVIVEQGGGFDPELWRLIAEQGWLAVDLPEDEGGLGLGFLELGVLAEQVGRHVAPVPFIGTVLALDVARTAMPDTVGALASGDVIGAAAWGDEVAIDAPVASIVVHGDEERLVIVDGGVPAAPAMDATRSVGWIDTAEAPQVQGAEAAATLLDRGAVLLSLELLGASQRMLEVATDYAKVREQFGRPIGSFQAVKHRLADLLVDVEGMRSAAYYAAWAVDTGAEDRSVAASVAKSWCADASARVMGGALQVHGGIGFTWEHDLHLYLKRAQLSGATFGTAVHHRRRVTRLLRERVETGAALW